MNIAEIPEIRELSCNRAKLQSTGDSRLAQTSLSSTYQLEKFFASKIYGCIVVHINWLWFQGVVLAKQYLNTNYAMPDDFKTSLFQEFQPWNMKFSKLSFLGIRKCRQSRLEVLYNPAQTGPLLDPTRNRAPPVHIYASATDRSIK